MCGLKIPHLDVSRVGEGSRTKADGEATVGGGIEQRGPRRGPRVGWKEQPRSKTQEAGPGVWAARRPGEGASK